MNTKLKNRRPALALALCAVALLVAGGLWWRHGRPQAGDTAGPGAPASAPAGGTGGGRRFAGANRTQPVTVAPVRKQDVRVLVSAIGTITAQNTALVRTKADGELKAIHFKEGQMVKAGQLLAEIDPRSYQVALGQAQGQLARDQAQLVNARLDLQRYKDLLAKDSIASQQVDTQAALARQLEGTVQADQSAVDSAKLQLSYTRVTAPISGRLGLKQADLGNVVHASDTTGIVSITQVQPIALVFAVPEFNLPQINRKLQAGQPMAVEAWDREQKTRLAVGKVATIDNSIDTSTGTIKLKAEFANADGSLYPNQFANVRLQLDTLVGALTVPTAAVQRGAQGTFVYVLQDDGSVALRVVKLGATDGDATSVQGNLSEGDKVVTDGADRLRDGAKVEVITPAARGPAAAGSDPAPHRRRPASADAAAATPAGVASEAAAERPRWMDRLPPEVQAKVQAMSPEERQAFVQKLRERRQQQPQGGGTP
ncbi:multidrug transporter subunit MdtA [Rhodoferax koreense]|uniref:Multidrug transporter subunit MdtA n=1 Tax=Rhodoferax koreensis TaxID=1842727 RepID=A0A1P8JT02_9BURK|nr:MdtA/MuxA family multidrug efflux RND transporter periplasmic adaptor subunit [Rhodoferax koreense]APW36877.1 multidrug transporter subunit MdtA [Rhodoferax koreense]